MIVGEHPRKMFFSPVIIFPATTTRDGRYQGYLYFLFLKYWMKGTFFLLVSLKLSLLKNTACVYEMSASWGKKVELTFFVFDVSRGRHYRRYEVNHIQIWIQMDSNGFKYIYILQVQPDGWSVENQNLFENFKKSDGNRISFSTWRGKLSY